MIIEAIVLIYLEALRDANTNSIDLPIHNIIQYLYDTYGNISPETLKEKNIEFETLKYNPNLPIDVIFNKIEKFTNIAEAACSPITQKQSIDFAYNTFRTAQIFTKYLIDWDAKPTFNQTWIQMKVDFCKAIKELRRTGALEVANKHANLVQEIVSGIQEVI